MDRKDIAIILLVAVLIGPLIVTGYTIQQQSSGVETGTGTGPAVDPGALFRDCTYTFYIDGSTYLATKGDGSGNKYSGTDASLVVASAFAGGGKMCFTEGTFSFSTIVAGGSVPSNLRGAITVPEKPAILQGSGIGKTILRWDGISDARGLISFQSSNAGAYTQQNITIADMTLDGQGNLQYIVWGNGARNVHVRNLYVKGYSPIADWGIGILVGFYSNIWVENNFILGTSTIAQQAGIWITGGGDAVFGFANVNGNFVQTNNVGIFLAEDRAVRITAHGNNVLNVNEGIRLGGNTQNKATWASITGNLVVNVTTNAIKTESNAALVSISDNIVRNGGTNGILVSGSSQVSVVGNSVDSAPIVIQDSTNVTVTGNVLRNGAIRVYDGTNMVSVIGNTIFYPGGVEAIRIFNNGGGALPVAITVQGNTVDGDDTGGGIGIRVSAQNSTIMGNIVRDYADGIKEFSPANFNIFLGNLTISCATNITTVGANSIKANNLP